MRSLAQVFALLNQEYQRVGEDHFQAAEALMQERTDALRENEPYLYPCQNSQGHRRLMSNYPTEMARRPTGVTPALTVLRLVLCSAQFWEESSFLLKVHTNVDSA